MTPGRFVALLLLQFALILINAFFAATELAVVQLNPTKLRHQAEEGDKKARRVLTLVEAPSKFLSTIQIGITFAGFLASAFAADNFAGPLSQWLYNGLGWQALSQSALNTICVILITLILSYFTLVLGELVPKQIALHKPYSVAKIAVGFISALSVFMRPMIWLLSVSTRAVLRLFGIKGERSEEQVTEDEIMLMVGAGKIDEEEKEMIENVFELDDLIARDVMTHRVDVVTVSAKATPDEVVKIIEDSGLSRYPVYGDSFDQIIGILNARTYMLNLREEHPRPMVELLREPEFVPETVPADVLLRDMQLRKDHMAIVMDEYGGFLGIVTMEDLIEEIVGNIYDEFDAPGEEDIIPLRENVWRIAGDAKLDDIEDDLDIELPKERDYDTLSGLVFSQFSSIPADGTCVEVDIFNLHIVTEPVIDHHVEWAEVTVHRPVKEDEEENEGRKNRRDREKEKEE